MDNSFWNKPPCVHRYAYDYRAASLKRARLQRRSIHKDYKNENYIPVACCDGNPRPLSQLSIYNANVTCPKCVQLMMT